MADAVESKMSLRAFFNKPLELTIIGLQLGSFTSVTGCQQQSDNLVLD
jgi:hypothetical protein